MSRGPGSLQREILEVLAGEPGNRMWWRRLKQRFPVEVDHKTFYRAVRSLKRMGRVNLYTSGGLLYLEKRIVYRVGDSVAVADEELKELLRAVSRQERAAWLAEAAREEYGESMAEVVTYPAPIKSGDVSDHQRYPSGAPSVYPGNSG